jgi:hypothetical protein
MGAETRELDQIAMGEGDWHVLNSEAPARVATFGQT